MTSVGLILAERVESAMPVVTLDVLVDRVIPAWQKKFESE